MLNKKIILAISSNIFIKFAAIAVGLLTLRWLSFNLNDSELATYTLVIAFTGIILKMINLGIPKIIQKIYTNLSSGQKLNNSWTTLILLRLLTYFFGVFIIIFSYRLSQTTELSIILAIFSYQFLLEIDDCYRSVCNAMGNSWQFSTTDLVSKIVLLLSLTAGSVFLPEFKPLWLFIWISFGAYFLTLAVDAWWQGKYVKFGRFEKSVILENLKPITYLTTSAFLASTFITTDRLFLKYFNFSDVELVSYQFAYKIFENFTIVASMSVPILASLVKKSLDKDENPRIFNKMQKFLPFLSKFSKSGLIIEIAAICLLLGIISCLSMIIVGPVIILIVTRKEFFYANYILPILAIALIPYFLVQFFSHLLIFFSNEKFELISVFCTMLVGLAGYTILISSYGAIGAALATLVIYVFDMLLKMIILMRLFEKEKYG